MITQEDILYIPEAEAREMVDKECFPLTTKIYNSINKVDNDTGENFFE